MKSSRKRSPLPEYLTNVVTIAIEKDTAVKATQNSDLISQDLARANNPLKSDPKNFLSSFNPVLPI